MTTQIVIHSGPLTMFGAKAEMAAIEKDIDWTREFVPFSIATLYEPKSSAVLRINPKQEVPVLIDGDLALFDSTQIFEYLEELSPHPALWPKERSGRARARLLELKSDEVFFPNVVNCMPHRRAALGEPGYRDSVVQIHEYFSEMNSLLAGEAFLAGPFGFADIAFYSAQFFARFLGQPPSAELRNLERWRQAMNERDSVQQVMGDMAAYLNTNGVDASI